MSMNMIGAGRKTLAEKTRSISLGSGQVYLVPAGQYMLLPGPLTALQAFDPVSQVWFNVGDSYNNTLQVFSSDGWNYRLANLTGTMVGAVITNAGTGYTNGIYYPSGYPIANPNAQVQAGTAAAPSVTVAAGGGSILAQPNLIVGGAINTTIAITAAGSGYTRAPILIIDPPPPGGVQATAVCTISGGVVNAVTVTNQGAGYTQAPKVTVVNAMDDTTGSGCILTVNATLVGSGTITAITMANNGAGMTSVPALTFAPASTTAATAVMCFTITTGVAQTNASNMGTGNIGFALGGLTAGSSVLTNPAISTGFYRPRLAVTAFNTTAGGGITFIDGGLHQTIPAGIAYAVLSNGTISAAATAVAQTVGGSTDLSQLMQL